MIVQDIIIIIFRSITGKYYEIEQNNSTISATNNFQMNNTVQQHQLKEESYFIYYILSLVFLLAIFLITVFCFYIKRRRFSNSNTEMELTDRTVLNNRK